MREGDKVVLVLAKAQARGRGPVDAQAIRKITKNPAHQAALCAALAAHEAMTAGTMTGIAWVKPALKMAFAVLQQKRVPVDAAAADGFLNTIETRMMSNPTRTPQMMDGLIRTTLRTTPGLAPLYHSIEPMLTATAHGAYEGFQYAQIRESLINDIQRLETGLGVIPADPSVLDNDELSNERSVLQELTEMQPLADIAGIAFDPEHKRTQPLADLRVEKATLSQTASLINDIQRVEVGLGMIPIDPSTLDNNGLSNERSVLHELTQMKPLADVAGIAFDLEDKRTQPLVELQAEKAMLNRIASLALSDRLAGFGRPTDFYQQLFDNPQTIDRYAPPVHPAHAPTPHGTPSPAVGATPSVVSGAFALLRQWAGNHTKVVVIILSLTVGLGGLAYGVSSIGKGMTRNPDHEIERYLNPENTPQGQGSNENAEERRATSPRPRVNTEISDSDREKAAKLIEKTGQKVDDFLPK